MAKNPVIKTPRGKVFINEGGKAELKWNTQKFVGGGGGSWQNRFFTAQEFVDGEVLRVCEPFIPLRTGILIKTGILGTEIGSGLVQWIAPYSKKQYYSQRKPGSQTGPQRGPYWFERAMGVYRDRIITGARRIAGRGRK
jgi:hypothetical protein